MVILVQPREQIHCKNERNIGGRVGMREAMNVEQQGEQRLEVDQRPGALEAGSRNESWAKAYKDFS